MSQTFTPGDAVHWTQTSARGRSLSMTRREGTVIGVSLDGRIVDVRTKSGKRVQLYATALRLEGQRGTLDEFVEATAAAYREERAEPTNDAEDRYNRGGW